MSRLTDLLEARARINGARMHPVKKGRKLARIDRALAELKEATPFGTSVDNPPASSESVCLGM